jgi:hypothetical protein
VAVLLASCGGGSSPESDSASTQSLRGTDQQLLHIISMGQSIGSGDDSFPVVTTANTGYGNFQFRRGVHTWHLNQPADCAAPQTRPASDFELTPIVAGEIATLTGETIASGVVDSLKRSAGLGANTHILFSFEGVGDKRLRDLDKLHDDTTDPRSLDPTPGGFYKTSIDDVRRAKLQADSNGWTYEVSAITWMQGEKNNDQRLDDWDSPLDYASFLSAYAQDLITLKNDWNADILPITMQMHRIPLFSYQTVYSIAGQAQLLASDLDPEIYVVSPTYYMYSALNSFNPLTGTWGNLVHLTGDSERWLGAQFAKVMKRVLIDGQSWQPLRPIAAWASADRQTVFVRYHVPVPPIVIDDSFMPAAAGAGLFIPAGPPVTAASVYSADTIALTLQSPLPAAGTFTLEYASENGIALALPLPHGAISALDRPTRSRSPFYQVVMAGDLRPQLTTILEHGVFYLQNDPSGSDLTSGVIRTVSPDADGNTVLQGYRSELSGPPFQVGSPLAVSMIVPYGNIRDSDGEQTTYTFTTGPRQGQAYPLWNWSVSFGGLAIADNAPAADAQASATPRLPGRIGTI